MFLSAGSKLDKYEVLAPLAVGGMAELYLARIDRHRAGSSKLCACSSGSCRSTRATTEFVRMFLDEARLAAHAPPPEHRSRSTTSAARHGLYFFAMEYVHGQDLARSSRPRGARARGRCRSSTRAHDRRRTRPRGLHHAHEQRGPDGAPLGIVHRDVSPTNILVSYDGSVKLVDFGIAKARSAPHDRDRGPGRSRASSRTCRPSSAAAKPIDRRSDVFSLGIVLYELTTGTPPVPGGSDYEHRRADPRGGRAAAAVASSARLPARRSRRSS